MDLNMTKCNEIKLKTLGDQFEKGKKKYFAGFKI